MLLFSYLHFNNPAIILQSWFKRFVLLYGATLAVKPLKIASSSLEDKKGKIVAN
jgi:hypothetical protein